MSLPSNTMTTMVQQLASADRLLIVAAAGLSISEHLPNNPYHNRAHFKHHYPKVAEYGYNTCYETMGIARDPHVPETVKKAFAARHFLNMRYDFPPTDGYHWLKQLATTFRTEDTFCWTSNVDGCFERAGFDRDRIYQTQGEMKHWQCADATGCGHVWEVEAQMREVTPTLTRTLASTPTPRCLIVTLLCLTERWSSSLRMACCMTPAWLVGTLARNAAVKPS